MGDVKKVPLDNDTESLFRHATELGAISILKVEIGHGPDKIAMPIASVPEGRALESIKPYLDEYASQPDRRTGNAILADLSSLAEWTNRHKSKDSVLFCDTDPKAPSMTAIIDYHAEGDDNEKTARFGRFTGHYAFPLDERWKIWSAINGKALNQAMFAEFLEENVNDLIAPDMKIDGAGNEIKFDPLAHRDAVSKFLALIGGEVATPAEVVKLSRGLSLTAQAKVGSRVNTQSGERAVVYEEVHTDGNGEKIRIPQLFLICIPFFHLSTNFYRIPVRIRYGLSDGRVIWTLALWNTDEIFDEAVRDAAADACADTALPLFFGKAGAR